MYEKESSKVVKGSASEQPSDKIANKGYIRLDNRAELNVDAKRSSPFF